MNSLLKNPVGFVIIFIFTFDFSVLSPEDNSIEQTVNQNEETNESDLLKSPLNEEIASLSQEIDPSIEENEQNGSAPEADQMLVTVTNDQCLLESNLTNDTSSVNTASLLNGSMFDAVQCPISPLSVNNALVETVSFSEYSLSNNTTNGVKFSQKYNVFTGQLYEKIIIEVV